MYFSTNDNSVDLISNSIETKHISILFCWFLGKLLMKYDISFSPKEIY